MTSRFSYRGRQSSDFGIYVQTPPVISAPRRDEEEITVPGRDGILRIDRGRYETVTITYSINFRCDKNEAPRMAMAIKAWLMAGRGDYLLADSYDRDYFRMASFGGPLDITEVLRRGGRGNIFFICHPYKYAQRGQELLELTAPQALYNPEAFGSLPHIKVIGNGACELYVNNETIRVSGVSEYVEIDSEAKQVYKGSTLMNANTTMGEFPVLAPGENSFDWNSNVTAVEIIPRWRAL